MSMPKESSQFPAEQGVQLPFPFWVLDKQGECVYANPRWCQVTGQNPDQPLRHGWHHAIHPSDLPDFLREIHIMGSHREFSHFLRLRGSDGGYRSCHILVSPWMDLEDNTVGFLAHAIELGPNPPRPEAAAHEALPSPPAPQPTVIPTAPEPSHARFPGGLSTQKALEVLLASEERLRWVFENIPVMVVALDERRRIVSWNRECEYLTGYRVDEAIGNETLFARLFHHPEDRDWLLSQNGAELQAWLEHECEIRCKDGALRTVAIKNVSKNVPIPGWKSWWVALDITDRKNSELALKESEARLRLAMRAGGMGVWEWDLSTDTVTISESRDSNLGLPIEATHKTFNAFLTHIHPEDRSQLSRAVTEAVELKRDYELDFRAIWPDGSIHWIQGKGQAIYDEDGRPLRLIGITLDITDRKKAETERELMERRLQEARRLESIGVLAGGIAHDFNNILTSILGNASLSRAEVPPTGNLSQYLKRIEDSSLRAADLCKQMLAFAGKGRFFEQQLDLNQVILDSESMLQSQISKKAILTLHLTPNIPVISADPSQIRQVLINLVVNASEALGDQGGTITVSTACLFLRRESFTDYILVSSLNEGNYVVVEVSDNGCGMNPENISRIFDPFFSTKFAGRGLGLAAVQGITRGYQGALRVQSQLGHGTTIQILLPAYAPPPVPCTGPLLHGTVLVIDDEETVLTVAASILETIGLKTLLASSGEAGIAQFREKHREIDAILLDYTMPRMDGVRTHKELQAIRQDIPVLLMSGYNEPDAMAEFKDQNLAGFVQKPFNHEVLYQKLADTMTRANRGL